MKKIVAAALLVCAVAVVLATSLVAAAERAVPACPAGQRAVQSEAEITSNGCGVPGLHIQMQGSEAFERPCCDLHDACYATCGVDRQECESAFEKCMDKYCARSNDRMNCKSAAGTFSMGTKAMGSHAFKKSQEEACQCLDETDAQLIADAYIPHAERVYRRALTDDEEIEEKLDNFRSKVLPKYFKSKNEWKVLHDLLQRYPQTIELVKDDNKPKQDKKKQPEAAEGEEKKEGGDL